MAKVVKMSMSGGKLFKKEIIETIINKINCKPKPKPKQNLNDKMETKQYVKTIIFICVAIIYLGIFIEANKNR